MLALFPGIHGLSPRHAFSCPTALLPAGGYPRSVSVPKDKVGKATSEIHSDKSLFLNLKNTLPVLCHSLPVGFTSLLPYRYLPRAQCQSRGAELSVGFALSSAAGRAHPSAWLRSG